MEAPQCAGGCQYAADIGMREHSCAGTCLYLNHPDNIEPEVTMKNQFRINDLVEFANPSVTFESLWGVRGLVTKQDGNVVYLVQEGTGKTRVLQADNLRLVIPAAPRPAPADEFDVVAKPQHYQFFPDIEAIDIIARSMTVAEFRGYCLGNRLKYRLRAGQKDDPKQELDKSDAYLALFERCKGLCYAE